METIAERRAKAHGIVEKLRSLVTKAETEKRDISAEENEQVEKMKAEHRTIMAGVELEEAELRSKGFSVETDEVKPTPSASAEQRKYQESFIRYIRSARAGQPLQEFRAFSGDPMNITTSTDGGLLAPNEFDASITKAAAAQSVLRSICTVKQTSHGSYTKPVRDASMSVAAALTAEEGAFTRSRVTYTLLTIPLFKMTLEVPITDELQNDAMFDMNGEITEATGEQFALLSEAWYATGAGTTVPYGITVRAAAGLTAASASAITMDELKTLQHSVKPAHRNAPGAGWLMNDNTLLSISLLKDGNQNYYLQPSVKEGEEYRIGGRPIYISDQMPDMGSATVPVLFGNFKRYIIVDRQSSVLVDPYSQSSNGVTLIKTFIRTGGDIELAEAIKKLTMKA